MKQTKKKMNRILAILLVAVMVVISLPQTGMQALASESQLQTEGVEEIKESESYELEEESDKEDATDTFSKEDESSITEKLTEEIENDDVSVSDEDIEEKTEIVETSKLEEEMTDDAVSPNIEEDTTEIITIQEESEAEEETEFEILEDTGINSVSETGDVVTVTFAGNNILIYTEDNIQLTSRDLSVGEELKFKVEADEE